MQVAETSHRPYQRLYIQRSEESWKEERVHDEPIELSETLHIDAEEKHNKLQLQKYKKTVDTKKTI